MDTQEVKISEVIPYEKNIKRHSDEQIEQIAGSITEFGYIQPVVVDENNVIVIGHGRFEALKKLGKKTIQVIKLVGVPAEKIRALRIADNKMNESPYDFSNLQFELKELSGVMDLTELGFTEFELSNYGIASIDVPHLTNEEDFELDETGAATATKQKDQEAYIPGDIIGNQQAKKPITFFCTPEEFEILNPIFATSKKWEANTSLLLEYVNGQA